MRKRLRKKLGRGQFKVPLPWGRRAKRLRELFPNGNPIVVSKLSSVEIERSRVLLDPKTKMVRCVFTIRETSPVHASVEMWPET